MPSSRDVVQMTSDHPFWAFLDILYVVYTVPLQASRGFACERVRLLPICISVNDTVMTCGCFRKLEENSPQNILHDNVYYPKRLFIKHYTEVSAAQHGSHPNPMHYKNYTL